MSCHMRRLRMKEQSYRKYGMIVTDRGTGWRKWSVFARIFGDGVARKGALRVALWRASVVFSLAEYQSAGCPVLLGQDTRPAWARRPLARPGFGPELDDRFHENCIMEPMG
jgi:hypothetical protein